MNENRPSWIEYFLFLLIATGLIVVIAFLLAGLAKGQPDFPVKYMNPAAPFPLVYAIYKSPCEKHRGYKIILTDDGLIMARCVDCGHIISKLEIERLLNAGQQISVKCKDPFSGVFWFGVNLLPPRIRYSMFFHTEFLVYLLRVCTVPAWVPVRSIHYWLRFWVQCTNGDRKSIH